MQVLVIPDVHLKPYIFDRATALMKLGIADRAVCLMDIADDWDKGYHLEEYEKAYDAAIAFAKDFPDSLWCYGNHDVSYLWNERETGYSSVARSLVCSKLSELTGVLGADNPIKFIQRIDNVLFCHGGLCRDFVERYISPVKYNDVDCVIDTINVLGHYELWRDDSPLWFRPQESFAEMYQSDKLLQVVGHTPMRMIERYENVVSCDVFSTYSDGTPIGTREFCVVDTESWECRGIK